MTAIRVVNLTYLNSSGFRSLSSEPWCSYEETTPNEAARRLQEGECDVALVPIAELFQIGGLQPLRYGISSNGPVESVLLLSQVPIDEIETIYLDSSSRTSVILLKILLQDRDPEHAARISYFRRESASIADGVRGRSAALVIGDRAIELRDQFPYQIDLAELWTQRTRLPFVFALWAVRPERVSASDCERIEKALLKGLRQQEVFARDWAEQHGTNRENAVRYLVECIHCKIDDLALDGAREFLRRGVALGLFPAQQLPFDLPKVRNRKEEISLLLSELAAGGRISCSAAVLLAEHASLGDLGITAAICAEKRRRLMRFEIPEHRQLRVSNVCTEQSQACSFFVIPEQQGSFLLTDDQVIEKIESLQNPKTLCLSLSSGLVPEIGLDFYEQLFRFARTRFSGVLAGLSVEQVCAYAKLLSVSPEEIVHRLKSSGLDLLSSWLHHLLVDGVRRRFRPSPLKTQEWIEITKRCHSAGLSSSAALPVSTADSWEHRIIHLYRLRSIQDETGGLRWCSVVRRDDTPVGPERSLAAETYLRAVALSSIYLDNLPLIESSPFWFGTPVAEVSLAFGADRFVTLLE